MGEAKMTTTSGRNDVVSRNAMRRQTFPPKPSGHPLLRRGTQWAVAIFVGLLSAGQSLADETLTLQGTSPALIFDDTNVPLQTWRIFADDLGFEIQDTSATTFPFRIDPLAPDSSLHIAPSGALGFGTFTPLANLHVSTGDLLPTLRLQTTNVSAARTWDLRGSGGGFDLVDVTNSNAAPFGVQAGAPTNTLYLTNGGKVGFGTTTPDANSQVDIRSTQLNGMLVKRTTAGPNYLRLEDSTGSVFRCGVQGAGERRHPVRCDHGR